MGHQAVFGPAYVSYAAAVTAVCQAGGNGAWDYDDGACGVGEDFFSLAPGGQQTL